MIKQIELIQFPKINHVRAFVNEIKYRNSHFHKEYEFSVVLNGEGEITINSKKYACKKGDVFFVGSNDVHGYSARPITKARVHSGEKITNHSPVFLIFQISNHFLLNYFPQIRTTVFESGKLDELVPPEIAKEIEHILCNAAEIYLRQEPCFQIDLILNLTQILSYLYKYNKHEILSETEKQKNKRKNERLQRIVAYIDLNYMNHIRLEDVAGEDNLSLTHFSHMFSNYFGVTFQEYINLKRLEHAIRLMKNSQKNLLEISYESGFSDPKYMSKMFMKKFNCTPKQYRKEHLNETAFSEDSNPLSPKVEGEEIYTPFKALEIIRTYKKSND